MAKYKITSKDLVEVGYTPGPVFGLILSEFNKDYKFYSREDQMSLLGKVLETPSNFHSNDGILGKIANFLDPPVVDSLNKSYKLNDKSVDVEIYGSEGIEEGAKHQIYTAGKLPIAKKAALMPDAHQGYGLPIGGVLATKDAVIPYGVGVDIGCRMALTLYDMGPNYINGKTDQIQKALESNTFFGTGVQNDMDPDSHIMDDERWKSFKIIKDLKDTAWRQLGTSGGGNHFVDIGTVKMGDNIYTGILTHSGSRGFGAQIARFYTNLAKERCSLPAGSGHLAWLDMNTDEGQEYWLAMNLAGDYAKACHDEIHRRLAKDLGWKAFEKIENHHNFAWKEMVNGEELIVHRKGATPAGEGVMGIIPGSMASDAYIVRGKGNPDSINSASHGAGRVMSRTKAKENVSPSMMKNMLKDNEVTLIGGGVDESPHVYKDIHEVMRNQTDLVEVVGTFTPKIVKMAG